MSKKRPAERTSLGFECAAALHAARQQKVATGSVLNMNDVAAIIDRVDRERTQKGPATAEAVTAYSQEIGYPLDGAAWCAFYAAKNWRSTGDQQPVTDWPAEVRLWKEERWGVGTIALVSASPTEVSRAKEDATTFPPSRPWTPECDAQEEDADEEGEGKPEFGAIEVRQKLEALLELYGAMLSPVQRAHASEQFEALCQERGWN
jgi:hypothetical protein